MSHLKEVRADHGDPRALGRGAPGGGGISWDAEIITERPNELIGWALAGGLDLSIPPARFTSGGRPGRHRGAGVS